MRPLTGTALLATLLSATPAMTSAANVCSAGGAPTVPAIVELYTSEGCDSCPPADQWLGSLKAVAATGAVLPLAFHIDYWDYLGWKDPFADPAFGERHRERASESGAKVVYTPQVLYDNRELQAWRLTSPKQLPLGAPRAARADLEVDVSTDARGLQVHASGRARAGTHGGQAYVALYESGLSSDVKAGENRGVTLHHDFVVRRWLGPFPFRNDTLDIVQAVVPVAGMKLERAGVAVIAHDDRGDVIQAVSVPLRDCAG